MGSTRALVSHTYHVLNDPCCSILILPSYRLLSPDTRMELRIAVDYHAGEAMSLGSFAFQDVRQFFYVDVNKGENHVVIRTELLRAALILPRCKVSLQDCRFPVHLSFKLVRISPLVWALVLMRLLCRQSVLDRFDFQADLISAKGGCHKQTHLDERPPISRRGSWSPLWKPCELLPDRLNPCVAEYGGRKNQVIVPSTSTPILV